MRCEHVRPSLFRVAEGEAAPAESLRVARHVPDCTACRILLAREQRLHEMLEDMEDPVDLDERFLDDVMSAISRGPVPKRRRRHWPVAVKLAILAGIVLVGSAIVSRVAPNFVSSWTASVPSIEPDTPDGAYGSAAGLARLLLVMLDRMAVAPPTLSLGWPAVALGSVLPAVALTLALAAFLAFAAARSAASRG